MIGGAWYIGGKPIYYSWDPATGRVVSYPDCDNSPEALAREGVIPMKHYSGYRQPDAGDYGIPGVEVHAGDGTRRRLEPRFDLLFQAGGFDWGPGAPDPSMVNLAVALIADVTGDGKLAAGTCQRLKLRVLHGLAVDGWMLTEETLAMHIARLVIEDERLRGAQEQRSADCVD